LNNFQKHLNEEYKKEKLLSQNRTKILVDQLQFLHYIYIDKDNLKVSN